MFQGWISFFNAISSGLIKASVPIVAILAGVVTAFVTVWLERRKDQKEKLQDRKDMWLKDHWRLLSIYLKDISYLGLQKDELREELKAPTLVSEEDFYHRHAGLGTALCGYHIKETDLEPYCNIDTFNDNHKIALNHIESGYKELNALLAAILSDESGYFNKISELLKNMYKEITELMKDKFPNIKINLGPFADDNYNINNIINELIKSLMGDQDELSEVLEGSGKYYVKVLRKQNKTTDLILTNESILESFKENIWSILKDKYKNQIKELQDEQKKIIVKESQWNERMEKIIDTYSIGFSIKGKCEICEKILNEKNIPNIRPPEIMQ